MRRIAFLRNEKKRVIALLTALAVVLGCLSGCSPRRERGRVPGGDVVLPCVYYGAQYNRRD